MPLGTVSEVSFTSAAFSPKIARSKRSSGASSVSLFGVILPTRMSPGFTSAPTRITPSGARLLNDSSADQDRVLEVVTVPRHERAEHVPAESEFSVRGTRAVREDLPFLHCVT